MAPRTTTKTSITGHGVWHPETVLGNEELCAAFNTFVRSENAKHAEAIAAGTQEALKESTPEWVVKASGIIHRYVEDKTGLLDPERMCPNIPDRPEDQLSIQAEYAVKAARRALESAGRAAEDVDLVVLGCSNLQRLYPAIAIEVQNELGARGYGFDVSLGCSAATGATQLASQAVQLGQAECALVVVPELTTGHMNWRERDSHFIFGDASVALVVEPTARARPGSWEILSTRMMSKWSNNIRNNKGYLDRCDPSTEHNIDKLFHQHGRRVFKDVVPLADKFISDHIASHDLAPAQIARFWLHQANQNMNELITKRILGREATREEAPIIIDEYGNTASAGSLIAFSKYSEDLPAGSYGVMASFGAGYSLGSLMLQRQ
ncbi:MAG TPA: beta-ketoacyl-ACP synthase III [Kofleriaceae bacterium]|jgi:beta-ketodecanoyl-[acyl-carrier-protein] synthase|nr:beta-ketoacyl-ACP synthase III [Kofleriaceae bacterium]